MDAAAFTRPSGRLVRAGTGSTQCSAFVPHALPPTLNWNDELVALVSASDRAIGQLTIPGQLLPNPHLLVAAFKRREAVLSSRIEGTQASVDDLYLFEVAATRQDSASDVREVHNYVDALDYGLNRVQTLPLSKRLICELHKRLMFGVRGQERRRGQFREQQNWIGRSGSTIDDATYVPPPPAEMNAALDDFERYLNTPSTLPPLVRVALVHYQFEAIHPFEDGNGRIGRLLIALMLCMDGILPGPLLYISDYIERRRAEYYERLLRVSTHSEWTEWIVFFLRAATDAARDGYIRANRLIELLETYRQRFAADRASTMLPLVTLLFESPAITAGIVADRLDVTPTSAQRAINKLIDAGVVREVTGKERNRIYVAHEVLGVASDRTLSA